MRFYKIISNYNMDDNYYKHKYIKYKSKYIKFKMSNMLGGGIKKIFIDDIVMEPDKNYYYVIDDEQYKIAVIESFGIKDEFKRKGHGTRIINSLLEKYEYIIIIRSINGEFWSKFHTISCGSDKGELIIDIMTKYFPQLSNSCSYILTNKPDPTICFGQMKERCNSLKECHWFSNKNECLMSYSSAVRK